MRKTLIALVLTLPLFAQPKPIDVTVDQVNDRRSKGPFADLTLSLQLPKIKSSEVTASRVIVSAATDDTGRDLRPEEQSEDLDPNIRGSMYRMDGGDPPCSVSVKLKNPARTAVKVNEVRGEIELYMPGKDPNSVAEIAKFSTTAGKPLSHKALKANGVELALLSPAELAAVKKRLGDAKRKEYKEAGYEGEDLETYVKNYLENALTLDENSDVAVRLKDPNKRLQDVTYIDGAGEEKRVILREDEGVTILTSWGGPPTADWKLRVSMKTAKNVVKHAFVVKDVKLP
jgi:hypothetical protein